MFRRFLTDSQNRLVKFALIGVTATMIHVLVVSTLLELKLVIVANANVIAFILATSFSYLMNTRWSFEQRVNSKNALRFGVVSVMGCGITYLIASLMDRNGYHYLIGVCVIVMIVPIYTYCMHSWWTYKTVEPVRE